MKKLITLTLLLTMMLTMGVVAKEIDWASMTDEEIVAAIEAAQSELNSRTPIENQDGSIVIKDGAILLDHEGLKVTVEGEPWLNDYGDRQYIYFTAVAENNTSEDYVIDFDDCSVNGWTTNGYGFGEVPAGQKKRDDCYIYATDAGISSLEEIEECLMCVKVMEPEYYHEQYKTEVVDYIFTE